MVSQLKKQMRRGPVRSTEIPLPPKADRMQTLELHGHLALKLGQMDVADGAPELEGKTFYVGCWVSPRGFVYGQRAADGTLTLSVPVDTWEDFDTLKLQLYCRMLDPETGLTKPFPLSDAVASIQELCQTCAPPGAVGIPAGPATGKTVVLEFRDPIMELNGTTLVLTARKSVDTTRLKRSAMYDVGKSNEVMERLSKRVGTAIKSNKVRVPSVAEGFVEGIGFLPSAGSPSLGIPPVKTHYGALSALVEGIDRRLPHSVLAYYLQLVLTHQGLTIDQAYALPGQQFAKLVGDVLWGITQTAGGFPYEPDRTVVSGLALDPKGGVKVGLQLVTTEDIGLPFAASNFIGRDLTPPRPADLSQLPVLPADGSPPEDAGAFFRACVEALDAEEHPSVDISMGADDCETSGTAGQIAANTVREEDMSPEAFRRGLEFNARGTSDFHIFKAWTLKDVDKTSAFFMRAQNMMKDRSLKISLVVGLAGGVAANTESTGDMAKTRRRKKKSEPGIDDMQELGGHCFAALRHTDTDGGVYVRLLEGTSCVQIHKELPDGPKYKISYEYKTNKDKKLIKKFEDTLGMTDFLTTLSTFVSDATQVVNDVVGGGGPSQGFRVGIKSSRKIQGFVRPTIVMPCLHSLDPADRVGSQIGFYKWCLYTGLTCDPGDLGSLPLEEGEYAKCLGAGCRPVSLASKSLQGFGLDVDAEQFAVPRAVLNEVWPPMATADQFRGVLALWAPLKSLSLVNADLCPCYRKQGLEYTTITCMESPSSPALIPLIAHMKEGLAREVNRINLARQDSDLITMSVAEIGNGVDITLHVPLRSAKLTFMSSVREGLTKMGWNAPEPVLGKTTGESAGY